MKKQLVLLPLVLAPLVTGCGEDTANAADLVASAAEEVKGLDFSSMSTGDMTSKVSELTSGLAERLGAIQDEATAKSAAVDLEPFAEQLGALKKALGDKMPDLGSLQTAVEAFSAKFASNPEILGMLEPVLEKLTALTS